MDVQECRTEDGGEKSEWEWEWKWKWKLEIGIGIGVMLLTPYNLQIEKRRGEERRGAGRKGNLRV